MKKLLFFINTFETGGAEVALVNLANALSDTYDVTVMTLIDTGVHKSKLSRAIKYKSIIKNPRFRRIGTILIAKIIPASIVHMLFIGNKYDYEIAFLEGIPTKLIASAKTKKYAWVHIDLYNAFGIAKIHSSMKKHINCYKKFDKIICVSETVKEAFVKRFDITENIEVKHNIIDDECIRLLSDEPLRSHDKFRILSVGRLAKQKGYDRLLPIVKRLYEDGIDFELVIVGEGEEHTNLTCQAENLGISDIVTFMGFENNPYKYIKSADLMVFPSRAEGYSTVVCESIILGKPIIVSDCSGMKEILGDSEYGWITTSDDELYIAMKEMIINRGLRESYAEKSRQRSKEFSKKARLSEIEELWI